MSFKYNKEYVKKDGRRLPGGGPRDLQKKQNFRSELDQEIIAELREEVHELTKKLSERKPTSGFTAEQVDQKINEALDKNLKELQTKVEKLSKENKKLTEENSKLKTEIEVLRREIQIQSEIKAEIKKEKEDEVNKLTTLLTEATEKIERSIANGGIVPQTEAPQDPDRPKIGDAYIDPSDEMGEVESHIRTQDMSADEKEKSDKKVEKLRGLLGKLPNSN